MSSHPDLRVDWCSYAAAKYAVEHWHYSRRMPTQPLMSLGVHENGQYVGAVVFGRGNACNLNKQYGLAKTEVAELVRVAFRKHSAPTTQIIACATRILRRRSPGLRLLVSYADIDKGHIGTIYQALGWTYVGWTKGSDAYRDDAGRMWHSRMLSSTGVTKCYGVRRRVLRPQDLDRVRTLGRHKYVLPLDAAMRAQIAPLAKPYPKRAGSVASDAAATHADEGGATPTPALYLDDKDRSEARPRQTA